MFLVCVSEKKQRTEKPASYVLRWDSKELSSRRDVDKVCQWSVRCNLLLDFGRPQRFMEREADTTRQVGAPRHQLAMQTSKTRKEPRDVSNGGLMT